MNSKLQIIEGQMFAPLCAIARDPFFNIRKEMGDLEALAADIKQNGIRVPVEIREIENPMSENILCLVDGHRRIEAIIATESDDYLVPVQFERKDSKPIDRLISMFVRNTGKPLEPMEECDLFQRMLAEKWRPKDIAKKIGRTVDFVQGRLDLAKATPDVKEGVRTGKISTGTARKLSKKPKEEQDKAAKAARNTAGGKRAKSKAAKAAAGVKSMRT